MSKWLLTFIFIYLNLHYIWFWCTCIFWKDCNVSFWWVCIWLNSIWNVKIINCWKHFACIYFVYYFYAYFNNNHRHPHILLLYIYIGWKTYKLNFPMYMNMSWSDLRCKIIINCGYSLIILYICILFVVFMHISTTIWTSIYSIIMCFYSLKIL